MFTLGSKVSASWREAANELVDVQDVPTDMRSILRDDPTRMYKELLGPDGQPSQADPWQRDLIEMYRDNPTRKSLVCCSRQTGKSQTAAALALRTAICQDEATVLIISRALRQSAEVLRKVRQFYYGMKGLKAMGYGSGRQRGKYQRPIGVRKWQDKESRETEQELKRLEKDQAVSDSVLQMEFSNGSRIISLPCKSETTVGFSAIAMLIMDEAARIPDETYHFLSPTRAVSQGGLVALSTPFGKRGWFWEGWSRCEDAKQFEGKIVPWHQVKVTVDQCERIDPDWLEEERQDIGERWFSQEYQCSFVDTIDTVFAHDDVKRMFVDIPVASYGEPDNPLKDIPIANYG